MPELVVMSVQGRALYSNRRLARAAEARGLALRFLHPYQAQCRLDQEGPALDTSPPLRPPAVVLPRLGATISDYSLALVEQMELAGLAVVNRARAIALARHKFRTLQALARAGLPVPPSRLVARPEELAPAAQALGGLPLVAKLPSGRQGRGVTLLESADQLALAGQLILRQRRGLILQRFIPAQDRRDLRVLVVGDKVMGVVAYQPRPGEFRSNFHLGGRGQVLTRAHELSRLARDACQALGLDIAVVDIIQDGQGRAFIIEANYSPGFQGLEQATGADVAGAMVDLCLARAGSLE